MNLLHGVGDFFSLDIGTNSKGFLVGMDYLFILVQEEDRKEHSLHEFFLSSVYNDLSFVCIYNQKEGGDNSGGQ